MTTFPDYAEALGTVLDAVEALGHTETIERDEASRRVLAQDIVADRDLPPFNRAQMDGYALRAADLGRARSFPVAATISAGQAADVNVAPGHCVAIATGAPLPADTDTVIPHEQSDRGDPVRFTISSIEPAHAVHPRGVDARAGDTLVPAGTLLGAQHLGLAATVGKQQLVVARRPRATVLTSGDEVRPVDAALEPHQIRNSNGPMVCELLRRIGAEPIACLHVADDPDLAATAVAEALGHSDLLVTVGGVSVGQRDYLPEAFAADGVRVLLHGAAIQPGRPLLAGRAPTGAIVIGLPGNPVSALACTCLFCWPVVRAQLGLPPLLPWRPVALAEAVRPNATRRAFRPAMLVEGGRARVPAWAGSGDLAHATPTDGLVELPVQAQPVDAGTVLRFLPWP
ncbi:MAG: molybdopterin molybdotransferase MoeA [Planctomycetota bacterium]|jgi:molybdopterin molybdotransferase